MVQGNMWIPEYFLKVKSLCSEISELDSSEPISNARLRRYLIHGLRKEFMPFISSVQGWENQPSIVELENLLSNKEALLKQMSSKFSSQKDNVLYTRAQGKGKPFPKQNSRLDSGGDKHSGTEKETRCGSKICYRCGKEGHIKRDCRVKVTCSRCGKSGHIKKNCWVNLRGAEANAAHKDFNAPKWE